MSSSTKQSGRVSGLVIGTRKSGTTWLYENFRNDPAVSVSEKVKESGFFTSKTRLDSKSYEALLPATEEGVGIEVDTSVCYEDAAVDCILKYNPEMQLVLILRNPVGFLESRYVHSFRKGELKESTSVAALEQNQWLRDELNYELILNRFRPFEDMGRLTVLPYELLKERPLDFYQLALKGLGVTNSKYEPSLDRVNAARTSQSPFLSTLFSKSAILARKFGAHSIVNMAKSIGFHSAIETKLSDGHLIDDTLEKVIDKHLPASRACHAQILRRFGIVDD